MKPQTVVIFACLLSACLAIPIFQPQFGILASNSNEFLRFNGLTLSGVGFGQAQVGQVSPFLPPYVIQQQADIGLPPQMVPLNPQFGGPILPQLLPAQANQIPQVLLPPSQQEQLLGPQDPAIAAQRPPTTNQVVPQYYPSFTYQQRPGGQGLPYYFPYGYPQRTLPVVQQPTLGTAAQKTLEQTTQNPQLPLQQASQPQKQGEMGILQGTFGRKTATVTVPPRQRGDTTEPEEGHPNLSFLFEP